MEQPDLCPGAAYHHAPVRVEMVGHRRGVRTLPGAHGILRRSGWYRGKHLNPSYPCFYFNFFRTLLQKGFFFIRNAISISRKFKGPAECYDQALVLILFLFLFGVNSIFISGKMDHFLNIDDKQMIWY